MSSFCVNFWRSYASFWTYNIGNTVFRSFLLHALTYCAEILHMTLFWCTTDQIRVLSFCVNFWKELCLFLNLQYRKYTVFRTSPTCFDILSWNFAHDFVLMYHRSSLSVVILCQFLKELCFFLHLEYRKYTVFRTSPACVDILSWNFEHDFVLMYYRSSLSVVTLRQSFKELCLFLNLEYRKYTVFRSFLLHALTYWAEILHMTLFWCTTDQLRVLSLCVNFWRSYASFWT